MKKFLLVCAVMVLLADAAHAAGGDADIRLQGLHLEEHLMGPEMSMVKLENRVVIVEFWGYNCPPCRASLPELADWQTKYEKDGLVVIGIQVQNISDSSVKALCKSKGVNFSIYSSGYIEGALPLEWVPSCFLFDHTGKCLFRRGLLSHIEPLMKEALKKAPPPLVVSLELKYFPTVLPELKKGVSPASIMKRLKSKTGSRNEEIANEASLIIEHLSKQAELFIKKAKEMKESDAVNCMKLLSEVERGYAGNDYGREAKNLLREYKKDKAFKNELAANDILLKIRAVEKKLKPIETPQGKDYSSMKFQNRNRGLLQQIAGAVMLLRKKYPDTRSTEKAGAIAEKYGLL